MATYIHEKNHPIPFIAPHRMYNDANFSSCVNATSNNSSSGYFHFYNGEHYPNHYADK